MTNSIQTGAQRYFDDQGRFIGAPPAAAAPPAPAAPAAVSASAPAAPATAAPSPFDAEYNSGVAGLMFSNKNARDDLALQGTQDQQDFDTTMARMAQARGEDLQSANRGANQEGLFYSGQLTKRRGDIEHDYTDREGDARTAFDRRAQARMAALDRMGTFTADPNSPTGFTATGQSAIDLADLINAATTRRLAGNQGLPVDPGAPADSPGAAPAAVGSPPKIDQSKWVSNTWRAPNGSTRRIHGDGRVEWGGPPMPTATRSRRQR